MVCLAAVGILVATGVVGKNALARHERAISSLPAEDDHLVIGLSGLPGLLPH